MLGIPASTTGITRNQIPGISSVALRPIAPATGPTTAKPIGLKVSEPNQS